VGLPGRSVGLGDDLGGPRYSDMGILAIRLLAGSFQGALAVCALGLRPRKL